MVDTIVPVLGRVLGGIDQVGPDPTWPLFWADDASENGGHGPAPQWADDSDDTYGTGIWHGGIDAEHTGMWMPVWCDIPPVKVPPIVTGLTVRMRVRIRPWSPTEFSAWSGPPYGGPVHNVDFGLYNMNPDDPLGYGAGHLAVSSNFRGIGEPNTNDGGWRAGWTDEEPGTKFNWVESWEPSWQELYMPSITQKWMEEVWDPELEDYVLTGEPFHDSRGYLSRVLQYGARITVECPNGTEAAGNGSWATSPYDEIWMDVYEIQIVAHSPEIGLAQVGDARAFKGARR